MITLVTCTGDRPELFARQERYMARQTLRFNRWIVVDDGAEPTPVHLGQDYIRREPSPNVRESFAGNVRAGLEAVGSNHFNYVYIIEDDDWYAQNYLETLSWSLAESELVGEKNAHYYNVKEQVWKLCGNLAHASLCQTAFRASLIPKILPLISESSAFVDIRLWREIQCDKSLLDSANCVGLKGQKGRAGIGMGHRPNSSWCKDEQGYKLIEWIGHEDAAEVFRG